MSTELPENADELDEVLFTEDESETIDAESQPRSTQTIRGIVTTQQASPGTRVAAVRRPRITFQTIGTTIFVAVIVASLLTLWMPSTFTGEDLQKQFVSALQGPEEMPDVEENLPVNLPAEFPENKIGIVIGNKGLDEGEVCPNGLTEVEINSTVATYLQQELIGMGYEAELLDETDPRLVGYEAALLIALHCNSCDYINDSATGFKFTLRSPSVKTIDREPFTQCLSDAYVKATGLKYDYRATTNEIRNYYAFDQIDPYTEAMIFELGYMNLDQAILTNQAQVLAEGIATGLDCYFGDNE